MDNKAVVLRFFNEILNSKKLEVIDQIFHPEYVNHGLPIKSKGPKAMKEITNMMFSAFPDLRITVEGVIAEGSSTATRGYSVGTHEGEFMGIPPTHKKVTIPYIDVWEVKDGKLFENWIQMDFVGLMEQLKH